MALALAVLVLVGAAGSGLVFLGKGVTAGVTKGSSTDTVVATSATTTAAPQSQPSVTPHSAPTASPVLRPSPTPTLVSSPSPTPTPTLIIQPVPLVLQPSPQNPGTCVATQTITNTTGQTVGWQWQQQQGGFHFQINGGPTMDWPKDLQPGIPPGGTDTLSAMSNCQPQPKLYGILLTDTLGDQYTFALQLQ